MPYDLCVDSEIGSLKKVLLHRPGRELETLTPQYLEELLFEDIPWVDRIQEEHDLFAQALSSRGCEIFYYEKLLSDILKNAPLREKMLEEVLSQSRIPDLRLKEDIQNSLKDSSEEKLAEIMIGGLRKEQVIHKEEEKHLSYYIKNDFPYYLPPLPNLYFTRDPGAVIGRGIAVNTMKTATRSRETLILDYLVRHHPLFEKTKEKIWYTPQDGDSLEGGDVLVLAPHVIAIGCSARTSSEGIEKIAVRLFQRERNIREILVIQIPNARAYMHLDTVFTMLDRDKFTIFPGIEKSINVFSLTPDKEEHLHIKPVETLGLALKKSLGLPAVSLIQSGGGDSFTAAREQWNDSTNTLALAPGVVVAYKRNVHSNNTLRKNGIQVVEIEGSELVRGRGGPRCMSMPLDRALPD